MNSGEDESSPRFIFLRKSASPVFFYIYLFLCKNSKMIMFGKIVLLFFYFQRYFTIR